MFGDLNSKLLIQRQAQQICQAHRDSLTAALNFKTWLDAQADIDLTNLGFTTADVGFLRAAFADLAALAALTGGGLPPAGYPQPAGSHDYAVNTKQIIGPG